MRKVIVTGFVLLSAAASAGAADVSVVGLTTGRAVLVIDGGKPRTLKVGESTPENIRLLSATSAEAVIEVGGKRRTLTIGQGLSYSLGSTESAQRTTLAADGQGHFFATATVNGVSIRFLVDTGASVVTIGSSEARRAGIAYAGGQKGRMQTANGRVPAYRVKLDTVRLGSITLHNVDGVVVEGDVLGGVGLLGMSFLNRIDMRRDGDTMTLIRRY